MAKTRPNFYKNEFLKLYINFDRHKLIEKIKKRTSKMINSGAIKEVKKMRNLRFSNQSSANKIIGVEELNEFLEKKVSLEKARELIIIRTRQYAKRQATWARSKMICWNKIDPKDFQSWIKKINKSSLNLTN